MGLAFPNAYMSTDEPRDGVVRTALCCVAALVADRVFALGLAERMAIWWSSVRSS